jgi:hypothetical protein
MIGAMLRLLQLVDIDRKNDMGQSGRPIVGQQTYESANKTTVVYQTSLG